MNFLDPFWKKSFYTSEEVFSFRKAFFRLVAVSFIIGVIYTVVVYVNFGRKIPEYFTSFTTKALEGYPSDLTVSFKNGLLSKNIPGEIKLYPMSLFGSSVSSSTESGPHYVLTLDESKDASLTSFNSSDALVLLARDGWVAEQNNQIRINSYSDIEKLGKGDVFSKDTLQSLITTSSKYALMGPSVVSITILLIGLIVMPLGYLLSSLFIGLVIMILSKKILGRTALFKESYVLVLWALPTVIIVTSILGLVPYVKTVTSHIPLLTTILTCLFLWYIFMKDSPKEEIVGSDTL